MDNFIREFQDRVKKRNIKIGVVGLGYVGLPLAVEFAKKGFTVLGLDTDIQRVARLKKKESYITDVKASELKKIISVGKFSVSHDFRYLQECDCVLICVPTPLKKKYSPDISFIKKAVKSIAANIKNKALIILESTTFPGTTEEVILPMLEKSGHRHGRDFYLCFSPERIDPGNAKFPFQKIPKVVGGINHDAAELARATYGAVIKKITVVSSCRSAEAVKLLENTFRIVNIGLIDEMAMMAHKMHLDIWEIINAAKTKPFGFMPFYPGPGIGGHCIGKDPLYLYWKAKHFGFKSRFIKLASDITIAMPEYVVKRVRGLFKQNKRLKILICGVTYKKDIKDLRKSPSLDMIDVFRRQGIKVEYFDPLIPYLKLNDINLTSAGLKSLDRYDCVIIAVDHTDVDYGYILKHSRLIFDTRNVYKNINSDKVIRL